jgi:hypothetical protein
MYFSMDDIIELTMSSKQLKSKKEKEKKRFKK